MGLIAEKRRMILSEMEAGRGSGSVFPHPVSLEPTYKPYSLRHLDNAKRQSLMNLFQGHNSEPILSKSPSHGALTFIRIKPSREDESSPESVEQFILSLSGLHPIGFEIIGFDGNIAFQMAVSSTTSDTVIAQLRSNHPGAECSMGLDLLRSVSPPQLASKAYRLRESHFFPVSTTANKIDPLRTLFGTMSHLKTGELGALQVLFVPVAHDWQDNMRRASRNPHDPSGSPFMDLPGLPKIVDKKIARPLFAVSIRLIASNESVLSSMQNIFAQFESQENGITPVPGPYPVESIFSRNTFVHGAILNLTELSYFVHLPGPDIIASTPAIKEASKSYPVPPEFSQDGPALGINAHKGSSYIVRHSERLPNRHVYSCGKSGFGKSNLILSTVLERIEQGQGVGVIDPHGSLITQGILPRIPKERIKDTIYFNAGDFAYPMAINPLAHSGAKVEKEHIRVDLLDFFEGLFDTTLGVNVQHALNFFIVTLLQYRDSNLLDLERLLIDKTWRGQLLDSVQDERVRIFWKEEFPQLEKRGIITAITNKLSPLILPDSTIAPMLTSRENRIDFLAVMNEKKIFLANLSHGNIGKRNSQLLGKLLVSRLQIAAMMREGSFPDWFLFIDEFQHLVTPSMADILSGARKYGLHLWLANQMMGDVPDSVLRHVYNAATMIFFSSDSPTDQTAIEKTLSKKFKAEDIGRLKRGEAFVKMVSHAFNMKTERVPNLSSRGYAEEIIAASRARYAVVSGQKPDVNNQKPLSQPQKQRFQRERITETTPPVSSEERAFLEQVYKNPGLSVTKAYKVAGLSAYMGDKLKTALKGKNLVREVTTHLGQGSRIAKFLLLTPEGFRTLGANLNDGKGGILHRYWQSIIRSHAETIGYAVTVEESIPGSKEAVDLGLSKDSQKLAIEISVTTTVEHELSNAAKCLNAAYERIIILFLEESKLDEFTALTIEKFTDGERLKIKMGLTYDFCRFL